MEVRKSRGYIQSHKTSKLEGMDLNPVAQKKLCTQGKITELFRKPQCIEAVLEKREPKSLSDYRLNTVHLFNNSFINKFVSGNYIGMCLELF